jgi:PhzF family phenazine biosynthesis protein
VTARPRPFAQVDVFTEVGYLGNPVAVVLDAAGLSAVEMQRFTRWTNLSEAAFVLPPTVPGADYRVRVFAPDGELPFAGHPTLGTCHAWLEAGGRPADGSTVVQECGVGLVPVRRDGQRLAFVAPDLLEDAPIPDADLATIVAAFGLPDAAVLDHRVLDNGPGWRVLLLDSADRVHGLDLDVATVRRTHPELSVGVVGISADVAAASTDVVVEVRGFALSMGIPEDPVTGSLNAVIGQWLTRDGRLPPSYVARQGAALGREGRVHVTRAGDEVLVGGASVTCVRGTVLL